jgi:hypothetical protein
MAGFSLGRGVFEANFFVDLSTGIADHHLVFKSGSFNSIYYSNPRGQL